jgi:hypothetical protein
MTLEVDEAHRGSEPEPSRMSLFLRASARTLLNFHCLRVTISYPMIRSHGEYYHKVPLRELVESTSMVNPISTHYPRPSVTPMQISVVVIIALLSDDCPADFRIQVVAGFCF